MKDRDINVNYSAHRILSSRKPGTVGTASQGDVRRPRVPYSISGGEISHATKKIPHPIRHYGRKPGIGRGGYHRQAGTSQPATHAALAAQNESFPPVNLDACPTLHTGYPTGGCVAQLQTDLNTILGLNLSVDGTFGPVHSQTYNAVIAFQQKYHLSQDGKVGPDTKNALERALSGDSVPTPTVPPATTSAPSAPASGAPVTSPAPSANAGSPTGELTALYVHFLDRQPDGVSWNNYMNSGLGINSDCRSGMLRATYDIATSAEAINRWQTPQNLAGAIYAGMLDRVRPPPGCSTTPA